MKRVNVGLIDNDEWFRDMFSQFMVHTCRNVNLTSEDLNGWKNEACQANLMIEDIYDIYIFGGAGKEYLSDEKLPLLSERSVFLCRDDKEISNLRDIFPSACSVSKYSSAADIVSHINHIISERRIVGTLMTDEGAFFVISVTSTCGGAGKTSFSITLARLLQQQKKRNVLILSISLLHDIDKYFVHDDEPQCRTLNEYLYHLFAGDRPEDSLPLYIVKDRFGISSFSMQDGISELPGLETAEMKQLIDSIRRSGQFDTLILDLDNSNNEVTGLIAEQSDVMFILSSPEDDIEKTVGRWSTRILEYCSEGPGTMRVVINKEGQDEGKLKFCETSDRKRRYGSRMRSFSLPYDPYSFFFENGIRQISMTGSFAAGVDSLIKEVISFA